MQDKLQLVGQPRLTQSFTEAFSILGFLVRPVRHDPADPTPVVSEGIQVGNHWLPRHLCAQDARTSRRVSRRDNTNVLPGSLSGPIFRDSIRALAPTMIAAARP